MVKKKKEAIASFIFLIGNPNGSLNWDLVQTVSGEI
jgi:hypothetical protein